MLLKTLGTPLSCVQRMHSVVLALDLLTVKKNCVISALAH